MGLPRCNAKSTALWQGGTAKAPVGEGSLTSSSRATSLSAHSAWTHTIEKKVPGGGAGA